MNVESATLGLLALGILGARLASLKLLAECKRELSGTTSAINGSVFNLEAGLDEMIRIGADVADNLDAMRDGQKVVASANQLQDLGEVDIPSTIMQLMVNRFLGAEHGTTQEQVRPVHEQQETSQDDNLSSPETPENEIED